MELTNHPTNVICGASALYPKEVELWPMQRRVVENAKLDLLFDGWTLLKMGQRSGKNVMAAELARPYRLAYVFDTNMESLCGFFPIPTRFCGTTIPEILRDKERNKNTVAIINEAMWLENSFNIFNEVRKHVPTIAIGSNGPQFDDMRWREVKGHSYASWEINPQISRENLYAQVGAGNDEFARLTFWRDFGAF